MSCICIIDTSIFLNLLNVPGKNQDSQQVIESYKLYSESQAIFLLPMATIIETGNHIAQNGNGSARRATASRFVTTVTASFNGEAPFTPSEFPSASEILSWLEEFPTEAGKNKSPQKTGEGTSFGDLSIIKEFNKAVERFSMSEVFIWTLDSDLASYHHVPAN